MRNATPFAAGRRFDVICLGRFAVDFYAQQIGARLEDVTSFAKYLGGSSANTAFGCARLGLRAALISRVGDDGLGRFLVETIAREGCDVSHVGIDPSRLTGAVVLGIEDKDTFPLIFLRENCADMAIAEDDVDEAFIAQSKALLITGTHFSTAHVDRISKLALDRARKNDVRTVLDIDYRPVLWGLTARGDGATRYVRSDTVTAHLQTILPKIDLVVGTIEEFNIAGGATDIIESLAAVRRVTPAVLLVKRGPLGCAVIDGPIPALARRRVQWARRRRRGAQRSGRRRCVLGGIPVGVGPRRGLRCLLPLRQCLRRAGCLAPWLRAGNADTCRARLFSGQRRADSAPRSGCKADPAASGDRAAPGARPGFCIRVRSPQPVLRPGAASRAPAKRCCRSSKDSSSKPSRRPKPRWGSPAPSVCSATTATGRMR